MNIDQRENGRSLGAEQEIFFSSVCAWIPYQQAPVGPVHGSAWRWQQLVSLLLGFRAQSEGHLSVTTHQAPRCPGSCSGAPLTSHHITHPTAHTHTPYLTPHSLPPHPRMPHSCRLSAEVPLVLGEQQGDLGLQGFLAPG